MSEQEEWKLYLTYLGNECNCSIPEIVEIDGMKYHYICLKCGEYAGWNKRYEKIYKFRELLQAGF
jgi:hypothetical protein